MLRHTAQTLKPMIKIKVEVEFEIDNEIWGAESKDISEKKWFWDTILPTSIIILHSNECGDTISQTSKFVIKEINKTPDHQTN